MDRQPAAAAAAAAVFPGIGHPPLELRVREGMLLGQGPEMWRATATVTAGHL